MPTLKSASKRLRQSQEKRLVNRSVKRSIKTQYRKVVDAVDAGNIEQAEKELKKRRNNSIVPVLAM